MVPHGDRSGVVIEPYLTDQWYVDAKTLAQPAIDAVRARDRHELGRWVLAIAGAGVLRLCFSVARRLVAGRVSLGVELDLRGHLYGQLQRLELSFFDHQQTGQLMSRATVDLQAVRFFLGYGLIFITQSTLTIMLAAIAMFAIKPELAAL